MDYKYIEQLIARYFEAQTSNAEEAILRAFFCQSDVPRHLARYAALFAYEAQESSVAPLDESFDRRLLARLEADSTPVLHVKAMKMNWSERFRPLWRSAAAVAIVVLIAGAAQQATVQTNHSPTFYGTEAHQIKQIATPNLTPSDAPYRQARENMKMAITADSVRGIKAETPRPTPDE